MVPQEAPRDLSLAAVLLPGVVVGVEKGGLGGERK